jgi:ketosteroid isomerase-like protein
MARAEGTSVRCSIRGLYAPMSTVSPPAELLGPQAYVGRAGFVEWLGSWTENFDDWRFSFEQIVDAGGDHVVAVVRQTARGRGSGAVVEERCSVLYTLKDGQVVHQQVYLDPAAAAQAAGLRE